MLVWRSWSLVAAKGVGVVALCRLAAKEPRAVGVGVAVAGAELLSGRLSEERLGLDSVKITY